MQYMKFVEPLSSHSDNKKVKVSLLTAQQTFSGFRLWLIVFHSNLAFCKATD